MIDRFCRHPNEHDREALQAEIQRQRDKSREEVLSGAAAVLVWAACIFGADTFAHVSDRAIGHGVTTLQRLAIDSALLAIALVGGILASSRGRRGGGMKLIDFAELRDRRRRIAALETALHGEVYVLRCGATEVIAFGDDDEIDCFAFQAGPDRVLVMDGSARKLASGFPSTSFEIVSVTPDMEDEIAFRVAGKPLRVRRRFPNAALHSDAISDQGELAGRLEDLVATTAAHRRDEVAHMAFANPS